MIFLWERLCCRPCTWYRWVNLNPDKSGAWSRQREADPVCNCRSSGQNFHPDSGSGPDFRGSGTKRIGDSETNRGPSSLSWAKAWPEPASMCSFRKSSEMKIGNREKTETGLGRVGSELKTIFRPSTFWEKTILPSFSQVFQTHPRYTVVRGFFTISD